MTEQRIVEAARATVGMWTGVVDRPESDVMQELIDAVVADGTGREPTAGDDQAEEIQRLRAALAEIAKSELSDLVSYARFAETTAREALEDCR